MLFQFDPYIAKEYGILEAVILQNIFFWIDHNKKNGTHFYNGRYWTYNSIKAFTEQFVFASKGQIERALRDIEARGAVISGNFNPNTHARTKWDSIKDELYDYMIGQKREMDFLNLRNGILENEKCNTDTNNTIVSKTDNKTTNEKQDNDSIKDTIRPTLNVEHIISEWNSLEKLGIKPVMKLGDGTKRKQSLMARLKSYTEDDFMKAIDNIRHSKFLQGGSRKGWVITFDWFVLPNNFPKVLEGNYNDPGTKPIDYSKHYYQKPEYVPQTEEEKRRSQEYWDSLEDEDDV